MKNENTNQESKPILTTQEAADLLGLSRAYLLTLVKKGFIPCHRVFDRKILFLRDELIEFVKKH